MSEFYSSRQKRVFLLASILLLGATLFLGLHAYATAFLGAGILFVLFNNFFEFLIQKKKWRKVWVIVLIILLSFFIIILPFISLSVMLTQKVIEYAGKAGALMPLIEQIEAVIPVELANKELLNNLAGKIGEWITVVFPSVITSTLDLFVLITIMYFVLFYMFYSKQNFMAGLYRYLPFDNQILDRMGLELSNSIQANVIGQGIISMVQAILLGLGFYFFGLKDPIFWGLCGFFCSFIPVLGTPLIWLPAGILQILEGNNGVGIGLLVYGFVLVMNIDNVLRLAISKRIGDTHPLITILGLLYGVPVFGILGLVIGPLLISYFVLLFELYFQKEVLDQPSEIT